METGNFSTEFKDISHDLTKIKERGRYSVVIYSLAFDKFMAEDQPLNETKCEKHLINIWNEANFINKETGAVNPDFLRGELATEYHKALDNLGKMFGRGIGVIKDKKMNYNELMSELKAMKSVAVTGLYMLGRTDMIVLYRGLDVIGDLATEYVVNKEIDARMDGKQLRVRSAVSYLMGTVHTFYEENYGKELKEVEKQIELERKAALDGGFWQNAW